MSFRVYFQGHWWDSSFIMTESFVQVCTCTVLFPWSLREHDGTTGHCVEKHLLDSTLMPTGSMDIQVQECYRWEKGLLLWLFLLIVFSFVNKVFFKTEIKLVHFVKSQSIHFFSMCMLYFNLNICWKNKFYYSDYYSPCI